MTPEELAAAVREALSAALDVGADGVGVPVAVTRPLRREHGDWSTAAALLAARRRGLDGRCLAAEVATRLRHRAEVAAVKVAGEGLLNITLELGATGEIVRRLVLDPPDLTPVVDASWYRERGIAALEGQVGPPLARLAVARGGAVDLRLLAAAVPENRAFCVLWAHARAQAMTRRAERCGVRKEDGFDATLLASPAEQELLATLADPPRRQSPEAVVRGLERLAEAVHRWLDLASPLPRGDETVSERHRTRLWLNEAARISVAAQLGRLEIEAPDRL